MRKPAKPQPVRHQKVASPWFLFESLPLLPVVTDYTLKAEINSPLPYDASGHGICYSNRRKLDPLVMSQPSQNHSETTPYTCVFGDDKQASYTISQAKAHI